MWNTSNLRNNFSSKLSTFPTNLKAQDNYINARPQKIVVEFQSKLELNFTNAFKHLICLRACLANKIWSLNFRHSIFITHHSIFHICLPSSLSFHHSLFFTLFGGPTPITVQFFFFFFH